MGTRQCFLKESVEAPPPARKRFQRLLQFPSTTPQKADHPGARMSSRSSPFSFASAVGKSLSIAEIDHFIDPSVTGADRALAEQLMESMPSNMRGDFVYIRENGTILSNRPQFNTKVSSMQPISIQLTSMSNQGSCGDPLSYTLSLINPSGATVYSSGAQTGSTFSTAYSASAASGSWKWVVHANNQSATCSGNIFSGGTYDDTATGSGSIKYFT